MENSSEFDNLLEWLGGDTASGARQYVEVRRKLVALFEFRGCQGAEDLADETLDRAAKAIRKPGFVDRGNPIAFLRGIARNVYLESLRASHTVSQETMPELADSISAPPSGEGGVEQVHACLDRCLGRLPKRKRDLLLRYYLGEKAVKIDGRSLLARELAIDLNTLRLQIFRLRNIVRKCVESCTNSAEMELRT